MPRKYRPGRVAHGGREDTTSTSSPGFHRSTLPDLVQDNCIDIFTIYISNYISIERYKYHIVIHAKLNKLPLFNTLYRQISSL